jgi:hypothetical protein
MDFITSATFKNKNSIYKEIITGIKLVTELKNLQFDNSAIYHKESKQNIFDGKLRSSKTHKIYYHDNSKIIFDCVDKLIEFINETQNTLFSLVPNDIDILKYNEGDFFKKHSDFIPVKNKYINYYTLLFCLDADCVGGETSLFVNDEEIKFTETITPLQWMLIKNEIEHSSNEIKSGHKIVLKANVIRVNLSNELYNIEFDKLITARNNIIEDFTSKTENILPVTSLSEYIFYRNCFKNRSDVIPFQFVTMNTDCMDVKIININHSDKKLDKNENDKKILWFNIGNNNPIIYFYNKQLPNPKMDDDKENQNDSNSSDEENKNDINSKEIDQTITDILYSDVININEIKRAIGIMVCCFWSAALYINSDENYINGTPSNENQARIMVRQKIKKNFDKIQKHELNIFNIDVINDIDSKIFSKIKGMFTDEFINKIFESFPSQTINYKVGGPYYCNENNYIEYETDIYFGFVKI